MRLFLKALFLVGLIYVLIPGPSTIDEFSPIPNSLKSDEPGDTYQNSNIAAYFSDYDRTAITNFYRNEFRDKYFIGKIIPPLSINRPPKEAHVYVRDLQMSTFLEEYVYPLRGSIFVNGYEPHIESQILKLQPSAGDIIQISGQYFKSKTTIRYYPNAWHTRLVVYLGIWGASLALINSFKKAIKEKA